MKIPEIKLTNISMEWTDTGARIVASVEMACPVCGAAIPPANEHRCGEYALPAKPARKRKARS